MYYIFKIYKHKTIKLNYTTTNSFWHFYRTHFWPVLYSYLFIQHCNEQQDNSKTIFIFLKFKSRPDFRPAKHSKNVYSGYVRIVKSQAGLCASSKSTRWYGNILFFYFYSAIAFSIDNLNSSLDSLTRVDFSDEFSIGQFSESNIIETPSNVYSDVNLPMKYYMLQNPITKLLGRSHRKINLSK